MNALPLQLPMQIFAGWANRHQQDVIEYLQEENQALREQRGGRIGVLGRVFHTTDIRGSDK